MFEKVEKVIIFMMLEPWAIMVSSGLIYVFPILKNSIGANATLIEQIIIISTLILISVLIFVFICFAVIFPIILIQELFE